MMNKLNAPLNEAEIRQAVAVVRCDGLPQWTTADRDIDNKHIVVWHTVNYHHWPRPEDWPVQPTVYARFHWMADGFFDGFFDKKPTMDMPRR
jgi:primary-amine oxidase